jgi:membrane protein DedA with SNARE-associated domain
MFSNFSDYGYLGVFLALSLAGLGVPIPEELPVITAGVLCGHADTLRPGETELDPNRLKWWIMLPVCIIGIVICDGLLYGIGRAWGPRLLNLEWVRRRIVTPEKRTRIEKNIREKGILILLGARFLPGIRSPIFIIAGTLRVPLARFLVADGLYAVPGVNLLFWLAYFLTDQMMVIYHNMHDAVVKYRPLVLVCVLSGVIGAVLYRYVIARRVTTGEPPPPVIAKPAVMITHAVEHAVGTVEHVVEKAAQAVVQVAHLGHADKPPEEKPPEAGEKPPPGVNGEKPPAENGQKAADGAAPAEAPKATPPG